MKLIKKKEENYLNPDSAGQMLQNIFEACDVQPNTVPLEALESYSNYRRDRFALQKLAIIIVIIIFCLIPFFFISPKLTIAQQGTYDNLTYRVTVDSPIPEAVVSATLDGRKIPVYQMAEKVYTVEPDSNGKLIVTAKLVNKQYNAITANVTDYKRDTATPVVTSHNMDGKAKKLHLFVEDDKSGVDFSSIYATDNNGKKIKPVINKETNEIIIDYSDKNYNLFISDYSGNTLQVVLTAQD